LRKASILWPTGRPFHVATMSQTTPFNLTGHPVVVCASSAVARGLPNGVQVVGRRWGEMSSCDCKQLAEVVGHSTVPQDTESGCCSVRPHNSV